MIKITAFPLILNRHLFSSLRFLLSSFPLFLLLVLRVSAWIIRVFLRLHLLSSLPCFFLSLGSLWFLLDSLGLSRPSRLALPFAPPRNWRELIDGLRRLRCMFCVIAALRPRHDLQDCVSALQRLPRLVVDSRGSCSFSLFSP